jgi:hypothetical protein
VGYIEREEEGLLTGLHELAPAEGGDHAVEEEEGCENP